jgi:hypothetical protein
MQHAGHQTITGRLATGAADFVYLPIDVPQGMRQIDVSTLTFGAPPVPFTPHYPPQKVAGTGRGWYRGDGHLHTVHSDGRRPTAAG